MILKVGYALQKLVALLAYYYHHIIGTPYGLDISSRTTDVRLVRYYLFIGSSLSPQLKILDVYWNRLRC